MHGTLAYLDFFWKINRKKTVGLKKFFWKSTRKKDALNGIPGEKSPPLKLASAATRPMHPLLLFDLNTQSSDHSCAGAK